MIGEHKKIQLFYKENYAYLKILNIKDSTLTNHENSASDLNVPRVTNCFGSFNIFMMHLKSFASQKKKMTLPNNY